METHDLVIVGAGPAGLAAGIYAGRARLKVVMLESMMPGGQVAMTAQIENYPGAGLTTGAELTAAMAAQAKEFGASIETAEVTGVEQTDDGFTVRAGPKSFGARSVIVATGTAYRRLGVPGEAEFIGRGVSYCATCDGPFFKDQEIAVVGGGDSALQEALHLTNFASRVYLIHRRDEFRAVPILVERVQANEKIECLCSHVVERINGKEGVESLSLTNLKTGEPVAHNISGLFVFVGLTPRTDFVLGQVATDCNGFIITDNEMKTSVRGMLAAGDCRLKLLRQVVTAVGDGAMAAFCAQRFLEEGEWEYGDTRAPEDPEVPSCPEGDKGED